MADDGATRARRAYWHKRNDHKFCRDGCGRLEAVPAPVEGASSVAETVRSVLGVMKLPPDRPVAALAALATALAERVDAGSASDVAQLRLTLIELGKVTADMSETPGLSDDELAEVLGPWVVGDRRDERPAWREWK